MPALRCYRLGPLVLASELDIPELPEVEQSGVGPVVSIRLGRVPSRIEEPLLVTPIHQANTREYLLHIAGSGSFYARDGESVIIDPEQGAPAPDLRTYLLGIIFAVLCHQRGLLPLHASAVETPMGAVAFLGDSGAGKSSLAAFLERRGFPVIADDICLIDPEAPLPARVLPVAPWLKLWRDTLTLLDESAEGLPRTFSTDDKYRLPIAGTREPLPLAEVVFLDRPDSSIPGPMLERVGLAKAVQQLMRYTFRAYLMSSTGQTAVHFQRCGKALEGTQAWLLQRPWGFDRMPGVLDALAAHFAGH